MDKFEAQILLKNLINRIVAEPDGGMHLPGALTASEKEALEQAIAALGGFSGSQQAAPSPLPPLPVTGPQEDLSDATRTQPAGNAADDQNIISGELEASSVVAPELDLSVLRIDPAPSHVRLCLDFGTAMSKATLVDDEAERIQVLPLGSHGNQEQIGEDLMLVSSIYIDNHGTLWFGQQAMDRSLEEDEGGTRDRIDSVKASISDGGLHLELSERQNPTRERVTYEDMVLANLMFLTWAVNHCVEELDYPRNLQRRFAMPCLAGEREAVAIQTLGEMLGQAQVLADTFFQDLPDGIRLDEFLAAAEELRSSGCEYSFIGEHLTEPLGVAGSRMSFDKSVPPSVFMVIDVGAGTTDFGLFKAAYDAEKEIGSAVEAMGSNKVLTEAGNHLDDLLWRYALHKAQVDDESPIWINVAGALRREIRSYKETLFVEGEVVIPLFNSEIVEITLPEFLGLDAVEQFGSNIRETIRNIFDEVNDSWIGSIGSERLGVVLTGGGAQLPMIREAANSRIETRRGQIQLAEAVRLPPWLARGFPELEDDYHRVAVSLGGARRHLVTKAGDAKITAGDIRGEPVLGGYWTTGPVTD